MKFAVISSDVDQQQIFVDYVIVADDASLPWSDACEVIFRLRPYVQVAEAFRDDEMHDLAGALDSATPESIQADHQLLAIEAGEDLQTLLNTQPRRNQ